MSDDIDLRTIFGGKGGEVEDWCSVELRASSAGNNNDSADVEIYDAIGLWGTPVKDFIDKIKNLDVSTINLRLNSPGGDAFGGIAIYNRLKDHPATVNVIVDGLAASAASIIAMAADNLTMNQGSQMMIHDAWSFGMGNAAAIRKIADRLDKLSNEGADIYAGRAGGDVAFWRTAMQEETWYTGDEAVKAGLADQVNKKKKVEAPAKSWDLGAVYCYAGRAEAPEPKLDKENAMTTKFTLGDQELQGDAIQTALNELHALRTAAKPEPAKLSINGAETSDLVAIQAHILTLEQLNAGNKAEARKGFVRELSNSKKIMASQVDALTSFVLTLPDESYDSWAKTYEGVGQIPALAAGAAATQSTGATASEAEAKPEDKEIKTHQEVLKQLRMMNKDEDFIKGTSSYKYLEAHKAI